ncbi:TIGR02530 family flagellar biosynthesis protein [Oceanobacillus saliphilus]|uniref:TIGR02530 family flagellar biosynthesis protein n=1 Tax=Oceanobacillus saliphilus TaxID=2925834 RepID=UPI00201DCCA7|nr:TIGR02530 family flagellar biosynthesis protein [Oceanobacillus saliphilus]
MDHRIHQVPQHALQYPSQARQKQHVTSRNFKDVLAGEQQPLKISKHATQRLTERNIHIGDRQWQKIGEKMQQAKLKGVTDSLVVMNNAALLVNTKNNTVVTAMDLKEATSRIFTNINGTILIDE